MHIGRGDGDQQAAYANGRLSFEVRLDPGETWHCCLLYDLIDGNRHFHAPHDCVGDAQVAPRRHAATGSRRC